MARVPQDEPIDYSQPVAYDKQGRPLYAHPPVAQQPTAEEYPPVVYMTRPAEPLSQHVSEAAQKKHDDSVRAYPGLNLSKGEYVISAVRRHPIGLVSIWAVVVATFLATFVVIPILVMQMAPGFIDSLNDQAKANGTLFLGALAVLYTLGGVVATVVYRGNKFFLTNESVIQNIQHHLLSQKEQTISLTNIEDASYRQHGLIQTIFNYGSLRLSTEGDETTYRFSFVANPKHQVDLLNNAVEAFKNGRPVDTNEEN